MRDRRAPLSRGDVAILSTNLLWGTYWIPLRQISQLRLSALSYSQEKCDDWALRGGAERLLQWAALAVFATDYPHRLTTPNRKKPT